MGLPDGGCGSVGVGSPLPTLAVTVTPTLTLADPRASIPDRVRPVVGCVASIGLTSLQWSVVSFRTPAE